MNEYEKAAQIVAAKAPGLKARAKTMGQSGMQKIHTDLQHKEETFAKTAQAKTAQFMRNAKAAVPSVVAAAVKALAEDDS